MKPRTKIQHEVFRMNLNVIDIQKQIKKWTFSECNEKLGLATKTRFWCIDCGDYHPISLVKNNKAKCPNCKIELSIVQSRKRTYNQRYWVAFAELSCGELLGEVQVIRLFEVHSNHSVNFKPHFYVVENVRQFIPEDHSKVQYVARTRNMGQGYPSGGDLEIRNVSHYHSWNYNPCPYRFHPWSQFKPKYGKIGINSGLQGLSFLESTRILNFNSNAETLLKMGQYGLFSECSNNEGKISRYWNSIKIALRNKYKIEDAGMWLDYMDLLDFFGKDLKSPRYICPNNLKQEHDRYVQKKSEQERRIKLMEQRKKIAKEENAYRESKAPFFGLVFNKGEITIKVLESVKEFMEHGDILKHCVFANEYYKKKESLILAAYVNVQPIETVEVALNTMEIVQSRGEHNNPSCFNSDIMSLLHSNMSKIGRIYKSLKKANQITIKA